MAKPFVAQQEAATQTHPCKSGIEFQICKDGIVGDNPIF